MRSWRLGRGALALALLGCNGASENDDENQKPLEPPGASPEVQEFATAWRAAYCAAAARCCTNPEFSDTHCKELDLTDLGLALSRSSKVVFHADHAATCLAELETAELCTGGVPASCRAAIEGTLGVGEDCNSLYECAYRPHDRDACPYRDGKTVCVGDAGLGEHCFSTVAADDQREYLRLSTSCFQSEGLYCNQLSEVCEPLLALGQPCSGREECEVGLACVQGICGPGGSPRDPCTGQDDCADGSFCSPGNRCNEEWAVGTACTDTDWYSCRDGTCENGACRTYRDINVCSSSNWL